MHTRQLTLSTLKHTLSHLQNTLTHDTQSRVQSHCSTAHHRPSHTITRTHRHSHFLSHTHSHEFKATAPLLIIVPAALINFWEGEWQFWAASQNAQQGANTGKKLVYFCHVVCIHQLLGRRVAIMGQPHRMHSKVAQVRLCPCVFAYKCIQTCTQSSQQTTCTQSSHKHAHNLLKSEGEMSIHSNTHACSHIHTYRHRRSKPCGVQRQQLCQGCAVRSRAVAEPQLHGCEDERECGDTCVLLCCLCLPAHCICVFAVCCWIMSCG